MPGIVFIFIYIWGKVNLELFDWSCEDAFLLETANKLYYFSFGFFLFSIECIHNWICDLVFFQSSNNPFVLLIPSTFFYIGNEIDYHEIEIQCFAKEKKIIKFIPLAELLPQESGVPHIRFWCSELILFSLCFQLESHMFWNKTTKISILSSARKLFLFTLFRPYSFQPLLQTGMIYDDSESCYQLCQIRLKNIIDKRFCRRFPAFEHK